MLCKKYQIIPKPNYKPKIFFNNDIINYLQKISSDKELPNLLLYGNNGCGKQSLVDLLLYYMYKNDTKIVSNTITIDIIGSNEEVEIKLNKEKQKLIRLVAVKNNKTFSKSKKENYKIGAIICNHN